MNTSTQRIQKDIETLGQFTATPGEGMTRFTFSKEYDQSRQYIKAQMEQAGLQVREDALGDIIGLLPGTDPTLAPVMIGSHFDSVKNGGCFDGPAGVVIALEIARTLNEQGIKPRRPIEFCALIEEEGGRFGGGLFASRGITGKLKASDLETLKDENGISIAQAMQTYGFDPANYKDAVRRPGDIFAFLEMHIEQGPILEDANIDLGIVSHIVGLTEFLVEITGRPDHAGTTPMNMRADALTAAGQVLAALPLIAHQAGMGTVTTVGKLQVLPGAANIVPGKVTFTVDIRCKDEQGIASAKDAIVKMLDDAMGEGLSYTINELLYSKPVQMSEDIVAVMKQKADALGFSHMDMTSGAGHDAMVMADITPAALLFVPSKNGRSHCPEEWTDYEQIQKAAEVYFETLKEITK